MTDRSWEELIKNIRKIFYNKGITDELAILEPLGFFLLAAYKGIIVETESPFEVDPEQTQYQLTQTFPNSVLPQPPSFERNLFDRKLFARQMVDLISPLNQGELGDFYEDCIQYLITEMKTGGRYTTPRHITRFMGDIAELGTNLTLADLACGSGGILLNAENYDVQQVSGYEISINWARIAFTNLILHGIENNTIIVGDSFIVLEESDHFGSIVMNPPFGMKINKNVQSSSRFGEYSRQSEIAFLQLGLDHLSQEGTLVTLLPSGFLFSTGKQNESGKEYLLENSLLKSVVTFPDDTFQPYSNIQTHLLEIQNKKVADDNHLIWFYRPRYDGFTPGRNRKEDPEHNDLPLIQKAITWHTSGGKDKKKSAWFSVNCLKIDGDQGYRIAFDPQELFYEHGSKEKDNLLSTARFGLSIDSNSFLFKYKDRERNGFSVIFNEEEFSSDGDNLVPIRLSKVLSRELPKDGLQFDHEGLKGHYISPMGIREKNKILAQFLPQQKSGYLCFVLQPDHGYFSKQMLIDNTNWLPGDLKTPCILPVESPDQSISEDYPFYFVIWDDVQLSGYPLEGNQKSMGYFRSLSSGEDLFMVQNEQQTDDYYFIFFNRENLKKLPENTEGVVLDHEGVVLGVGVPKEVVRKKRYDLMPSTYVLEEKEAEEVLLPPAYILGNIKQNQTKLTNSLNNLLQLVEKKLPSDNQSISPQFPLFAYIDEELRSKWKELPENYFQYTDLNDIEIDQQALDLFVNLGLLLEVELGNGVYYRRLENQDVQGKLS